MTKPTLDDKGMVVACAHCGQKNRLPYARLDADGDLRPVPGRSAARFVPLDIGGEAQLDALVAASPLPVVVDFWAPWCGPCRQVAPELEKVAGRERGEWLVVKINTEALPGLGARFGIQLHPDDGRLRGWERGRADDAGARPACRDRGVVRESERPSTAGRP